MAIVHGQLTDFTLVHFFAILVFLPELFSQTLLGVA